MLTTEEITNISNRHPTGLKGVLKGYGVKRIFLSGPFWTGVVGASLITVYVVCLGNDSSLKMLSALIDNSIQFLPVLLGFNLGGYALITGFGNTTLIKRLTTDYEDQKKSMFQITSSVFAFGVLVQALSLLLTFAFWIIKLVNISIPLQNAVILAYAPLINVAGLWLLSMIVIYSLALVPQMIINVFTFSQLHHFLLYTERISEEKEATNEDKSKKGERGSV